MSTQHEEFPELTPEARAAFDRGYEANGLFVSTPGKSDRVRFAVFLREAMKQAGPPEISVLTKWDVLADIHRNLHSPPPPPPTLAQAREADLTTPEGRAMVSAFLANLAAETQP